MPGPRRDLPHYTAKRRGRPARAAPDPAEPRPLPAGTARRWRGGSPASLSERRRAARESLKHSATRASPLWLKGLKGLAMPAGHRAPKTVWRHIFAPCRLIPAGSGPLQRNAAFWTGRDHSVPPDNGSLRSPHGLAPVAGEPCPLGAARPFPKRERRALSRARMRCGLADQRGIFPVEPAKRRTIQPACRPRLESAWRPGSVTDRIAFAGRMGATRSRGRLGHRPKRSVASPSARSFPWTHRRIAPFLPIYAQESDIPG